MTARATPVRVLPALLAPPAPAPTPKRRASDWFEPDAFTLADALFLARRNATHMGEEVTVCAEVYEEREERRGVLAFTVLLTTSYVRLREQQQAGFLAPIGTVSKSGEVRLYDNYARTEPVLV